ncbi:MAG: hypothetical protein KGJ70_12120, partial [Gemmatimonadota bacterium]|nr:hypothetical protein [Gemmatimonadota bacterium]
MRAAAALVPLTLAAALAACSSKPPDPTVQFATVGFILQLPTGMQQALDAAEPGFRIITPDKFRSDVSQQAAMGSGTLSPLFATLGDFDGDGTKDAIVEGMVPGDSALHVVAIMNGKTPHAFEVTTYPVFDADAVGVYLTSAPAGKKGSFEIINYPDASYMYTYAGGQFTGTKI